MWELCGNIFFARYTQTHGQTDRQTHTHTHTHRKKKVWHRPMVQNVLKRVFQLKNHQN